MEAIIRLALRGKKHGYPAGGLAAVVRELSASIPLLDGLGRPGMKSEVMLSEIRSRLRGALEPTAEGSAGACFPAHTRELLRRRLVEVKAYDLVADATNLPPDRLGQTDFSESWASKELSKAAHTLGNWFANSQPSLVASTAASNVSKEAVAFVSEETDAVLLRGFLAGASDACERAPLWWSGLGVSREQVEVPRDWLTLKPSGDPDETEGKGVDLVANVSDRRSTGPVVVVGDGGMGKSFVLDGACRRLAAKAMDDLAQGRVVNVLPIRANVRVAASLLDEDAQPSSHRWLAKAACRFAGLDTDQAEGLLGLLVTNRASVLNHVLLDGLDEVELTPRLVDALQRLDGERGVAVTLTTRAQHGRESRLFPRAEVKHLQPLSYTSAQTLLVSWTGSASRAEELLRLFTTSLAGSTQFGSPVLLSMAATAFPSSPDAVRPQTEADFMGRFLRGMLRSPWRDSEWATPSDAVVESRVRLLGAVATYLAAANDSWRLGAPATEILGFIDQTCSDRDLWTKTGATNSLTRAELELHALQPVLSPITGTASEETRWEFGHRILQEYCIAFEMNANPLGCETLLGSRPQDYLLYWDRAHRPMWSRTALLLAQLSNSDELAVRTFEADRDLLYTRTVAASRLLVGVEPTAAAQPILDRLQELAEHCAIDSATLSPIRQGGTLLSGQPSESSLTEVLSRLDESESERHWEASRSTSEERLDLRARDPDVAVRVAVARNPSTGSRTVERLSGDPSAEVREAVASRLDLVDDTLDRFARDPDEGVRRAVAGNIRASAGALDRLADQDAIGIWIEVALHWATRAGTLHRLAQALPLLHDGISDRARQTLAWNLACHERSDATTLELVARFPSWRVRQALAVNPRTPAAVLANLAMVSDVGILAGVAAHANTPPDVHELLAASTSIEVAAGAAGNSKAVASLLSRWGRDRREPVRLAVARNPATPDEVVAALLGDESTVVRAAAIGHAASTAEQLTVWASDQDDLIRCAVASHDRTPEHTLLALSTDPAPSVRSSVAGHERAPAAALDQLAEDDEFQVRISVAGNPSTPVATLISVLERPAPERDGPHESLDTMLEPTVQLDAVRAAIAANRGATAALIQRAVSESHYADECMLGAARNPCTSTRTLELIVQRQLRREFPESKVLIAILEHPASPW